MISQGFKWLFAISLVFSLTSCKLGQPQTRVVEGTVFVTNQARENILFGSARIYILKAEDVALNVEDAETWIKEELPKRTDSAKKAWEQFSVAKSKYKELEELLEKKRKENVYGEKLKTDYEDAQQELEEIRKKTQRLSEHNKEIQELAEQVIKANDEALQASFVYKQASLKCEGLNGDFKKHLFSGLPEPVAGAITDAQGKFSVRIPAEGRFAIACIEERNIAQEAPPAVRDAMGDSALKLTYMWYFYLPQDAGKGAMQVQLGMENILGMGSELDVVRMPLIDFKAEEADL